MFYVNNPKKIHRQFDKNGILPEKEEKISDKKKACVSQNNTIINVHSDDCKNAKFISQLHVDRASRNRSLLSEQVSEWMSVR